MLTCIYAGKQMVAVVSRAISERLLKIARGGAITITVIYSLSSNSSPWPVATSATYDNKSGIMTIEGAVVDTYLLPSELSTNIPADRTFRGYVAIKKSNVYHYYQVMEGRVTVTGAPWYGKISSSGGQLNSLSEALRPYLNTKWTMRVSKDNTSGQPTCANMNIGLGTYTGTNKADTDEAARTGLEALMLQHGAPSSTVGCLGLPPAAQYCAMATPSVTLDYGTLDIKDAVGAKRNAIVEVHCTSSMKYTLRLSGKGGDIVLSNAMIAKMTANGAALNSTLNGLEGENAVTVTSVLAGTPATSGAFSGTDILLVSYP